MTENAATGERHGMFAESPMLPFLAVILFFLPFFHHYAAEQHGLRTIEYEANMYGLNAARQPDGEANVDMMLGEYRKLDPGPAEEFIFCDHPSGGTRITAAMHWEAEYPESASAEKMTRKIFTEK